MAELKGDEGLLPKRTFDWNLDSVFFGNRWLEKRLAEAKGYPDPEYARRGTTSWMRALAILVEDEFSDEVLRSKYSGAVSRRSPVDEEADTAVFVSMMMALQNLYSIRVLMETTPLAPVIRPAIVCWYYGVYFASGAMVAAKQGSVPETHAGTSKAWDACIVQRGLAHGPFGYRLSTLVKKDAEAEIDVLRAGSNFSLPQMPRDADEAIGAHLSYLKGTRNYAEDQVKESLLRSDLRKLGLDNFRTKQAQEIRDKRLSKRFAGFLDQAFRYRGKAHYRDPLYLGYADTDGLTAGQLVSDLGMTLDAFIRMASHLCSRCVERGTWDLLIQDLEANSATRGAVDAVRVS